MTTEVSCCILGVNDIQYSQVYYLFRPLKAQHLPPHASQFDEFVESAIENENRRTLVIVDCGKVATLFVAEVLL